MEKEKTLKKPTPKKPLSPLYRLFCWCSGSRMYILEKCPTDYNAFFGIGIIIFLTGAMAVLSGSYAFYTVFQNQYFALGFGLFWGTLIFFLDWYLVSSLRKQNKLKKELQMATPRVLLAIFLAVVISKPIELKLFEKEINSKIASMQLANTLENKTVIDKEFEEIKKLRDDNETMALQIKVKEIYRNSLFEMVITEAEGTAGTKHIGKGPVYQEKKIALDQTTQELAELKRVLLPLIEANTKRITELTLIKDKKITQTNTVSENNNGFLARLEALSILSSESKTTNFVSWFIMLLFICIESAPIFVKLIAERSTYDELLDIELETAKLQAHGKFALAKAEIMKQYTTESEKHTLELETGAHANKEFVDRVISVQSELNDSIISNWREKELYNIEHNFGEYVSQIHKITGKSSATKPSNNNKTE